MLGPDYKIESEASIRKSLCPFKECVDVVRKPLSFKVDKATTKDNTELRPAPIAYIKDLKDFIQSDQAEYFWFFTALMALGSIGFYIVNRNYKQTMILQEEESSSVL